MKVKPKMIQDGFMGDFYLGCPKCKEMITFSLIRNQCKKCGVEFDWSDRK